MEWLLPPIQLSPVTYFDPEIHRIDQEAKLYLQQTPSEVQNMIPISVIEDGNCLYNSIMCISGSAALTATELRGIYLQH